MEPLERSYDFDMFVYVFNSVLALGLMLMMAR
jgi:hypothetical protein